MVAELLLGTMALGVTGALAAETLNVTSNALMDVNDTIRERNGSRNYRSRTRAYNAQAFPQQRGRVSNARDYRKQTQARRSVKQYNDDVVRDMIW